MFHSGGVASTSSSSGRHGFPDEMEVSEILLSLPNLIYSSESINGFYLKWASKRRRSVINSNPSPPPSRALLPSPGKPKNAADASSPATPLSYLPSESDEKSKDKDPIRKISKRKRREELQDTVHNLEKTQREIKMSLGAVQLYHKQLLAYNMAFKAEQLRYLLSLGMRLPEMREETGDGSYRAVALPYAANLMCPSLPRGNGLIRHNSVGSFRIPDLNLSAEEASQPLDLVVDLRDYRAKAAGEARKRRILKMKEKMKSSKPSLRC